MRRRGCREGESSNGEFLEPNACVLDVEDCCLDSGSPSSTEEHLEGDWVHLSDLLVQIAVSMESCMDLVDVLDGRFVRTLDLILLLLRCHIDELGF